MSRGRHRRRSAARHRPHRAGDEQPIRFSELERQLKAKPDDPTLNARMAYENYARRDYKAAKPLADATPADLAGVGFVVAFDPAAAGRFPDHADRVEVWPADPARVDAAKLGILVGSGVSAAVGGAVLWRTLPRPV